MITKNIVIDFLVGNLKNSDSTTNWKLGVGISEITALFNLDNNPSAYMFKLSDQQGNDNGYVIVSGSKSENPIIEFSCTGKPFTNNAIIKTKQITNKLHTNKTDMESNTKLYYLGNCTYLAEQQLSDNTKQTYNISSGDCTIVNINELKKIKPEKNRTTEYLKLWDKSSINHQKEIKDGSTPPDKYRVYITDPSQYETNYNGVNCKYIPN